MARVYNSVIGKSVCNNLQTFCHLFLITARKVGASYAHRKEGVTSKSNFLLSAKENN